MSDIIKTAETRRSTFVILTDGVFDFQTDLTLNHVQLVNIKAVSIVDKVTGAEFGVLGIPTHITKKLLADGTYTSTRNFGVANNNLYKQNSSVRQILKDLDVNSCEVDIIYATTLLPNGNISKIETQVHLSAAGVSLEYDNLEVASLELIVE